jgi:hypothetical protein
MPAKLGHKPRIIPAIYVKPFVKGQKDDNNDAEALRLVSRAPRLIATSWQRPWPTNWLGSRGASCTTRRPSTPLRSR